ncbi:PREDICTED: cytochrome P450 71A3-like [Fragaria vesca subsp. vesca]|uniref:cytochrome P450 71A3-like n=1 Tax=Fragaria vesca subsp. vesca TaxID=101020 RepID=UPI0002C2F524|nr:PREDICTED: cytochrome P450 71A3-like [Fragaria vesca subsp. vesca]
MPELSETLSLAPLLAITLLFLYKWASTSIENSPPSPPKLPIRGNLHQLGLHPHRALRDLAQIHGPLMLLHFGSNPVLVVSSAEEAREIMKTHDLSFSNRPKTFVFEKLLYNFRDVASAPYGEYWRQMKSLCVLNLLSHKRVRSFRAVREEEVNSMIEKIKESSSTSSVVNMSETFATLTNDVTSRVALGRKYNTGGQGRSLNDLLEEFVKLIGHINIGDFIPWLAWLNRMNGLDARLDRVARQFDEFLERVIQEHVSSSESRTNGHARTENDKKDFVDVLLEIQKENSLGLPLERVSIKALILDMFAAGTETTYTFLEWALSKLLRNPMVMSKLQKEIRGIVGDKKDITEDDLTGMHYLKAVIKETFRLHPPAPLLVPRLSTREVKINGYNIKANTQVTVNAWHIGRDPNTYKNPEEFEPERFLIQNDIDYRGNDFQLIPFGAGRRICPGIQFSTALNEIALANILHQFNWELPDGAKGQDLDMTESTGITIHRKNPLKVVAVPYFH